MAASWCPFLLFFAKILPPLCKIVWFKQEDAARASDNISSSSNSSAHWGQSNLKSLFNFQCLKRAWFTFIWFVNSSFLPWIFGYPSFWCFTFLTLYSFVYFIQRIMGWDAHCAFPPLRIFERFVLPGIVLDFRNVYKNYSDGEGWLREDCFSWMTISMMLTPSKYILLCLCFLIVNPIPSRQG